MVLIFPNRKKRLKQIISDNLKVFKYVTKGKLSKNIG